MEFMTDATAETKTRPARPRPTVITLTDAAAEQVKQIIARHQGAEPPVALRVGIKTKGCSGLSYSIEYAPAKTPGDEVVEAKGVTVFIDPKATLFILGSEMDYEQDKLRSGFVFRNPNEKGRCGCGESFRV
jgi:iron-sulfur cluster assembly protein